MSTLKVNTLTDTAATKSVPIEDVVNGVARAWVNFNGTGTVAIRASYNVSSITDNGTGDYTVNFTNAMSDANYGFTTGIRLNPGTVSYNMNLLVHPTVNPTTSAIRVQSVQSNYSKIDIDYNSIAIFR